MARERLRSPDNGCSRAERVQCKWRAMGHDSEAISNGVVSSRRTRRKSIALWPVGESTYTDLPPGKPAAVIRC